MFFFFTSRRRHTRCALVTGVQTCALPILCVTLRRSVGAKSSPSPSTGTPYAPYYPHVDIFLLTLTYIPLSSRSLIGLRSEERRVGKECVSTCRSRWSPIP